ncbi:ABC transporter substrate-binding protein [Mycoplasmatota bacterium]|nr:ABC transporter substrate-binding protein [Mycoplasmatota bacterium]
MKKLSSFILMFAIVLTAFTLASCGKKTNKSEQALVVGYDAFSEKFSPFFSDTDMDTDVVEMTSVELMTTDRDGGIVYNAINGETIARGGKSYEYKGISDITVTQGNGKTTYNIKIRDDIKFSDGHVMDADDIIFSYYVRLDPYYTGSSSIGAIDIVGYSNYKYNSTASEQARTIAEGTYGDLIDAIGTDTANAELNQYVLDEIHALLDEEFDWVKNDVINNEIYTGYWVLEDGSPYDKDNNVPEDASAAATFASFYALDENYSVVGKTRETIVDEIAAMYEYDYLTLDAYYGGAVVAPKVERKALNIAIKIAVEDLDGDPVPNITGIRKISQTEVEVDVYGFDAAAIYDICGITVAPMHYYGDESLYNYANNQFGFNSRTETSMDDIQAKTDTPMGAGPYKFVKFENNVVYFKANKNYYKGEPKIKYVNFQVVDEPSKVSAIGTGDIDISNPSGSRVKFQEIDSYGDKIHISSIDNLGYGYIGLSAKNVAVGDDIDSTASKALRTAFATVLSSQRYTSINSYYGEAASIINYPISNTSWAAPKPGEDGYETAFSRNPDGTTVYDGDPADLADSVRNEEAKLAAKAWLVEAGYTFVEKAGDAQFGDSLYTATAPDGAKLEYEIIVPGDGVGDHPSHGIATQFKNIMAELGITITINDPTNSGVLWDILDADEQEIWCAAWVATIDPDMYQVYHSSNVVGEEGSTESNHYYIRDNDLDTKIIDARSSDDQSFRKGVYKECLDIIIDWAVEVPIYQRQNIIAFSTERVNIDTITPDITTYWDWMEDIEKLEMK